MKKKMVIILDDDVLIALRFSAKREVRDYRRHAEFIIIKHLQNEGLIPSLDRLLEDISKDSLPLKEDWENSNEQ